MVDNICTELCECKEVRFSDLKIGDYFYYEDEVYLKIETPKTIENKVGPLVLHVETDKVLDGFSNKNVIPLYIRGRSDIEYVFTEREDEDE